MFFGLLIGTVCLVGLVRVLSGRRWYRGAHAYARFGGCRPAGYGGYALSRLEATPTQERAILGAVDELRETTRTLRGTVREARSDVARTVRGATFDESALQTASSRLEEAGRQMRSAVSSTLGKIHGVLDDRQRKVLGDIIDSGPSFI